MIKKQIQTTENILIALVQSIKVNGKEALGTEKEL